MSMFKMFRCLFSRFAFFPRFSLSSSAVAGIFSWGRFPAVLIFTWAFVPFVFSDEGETILKPDNDRRLFRFVTLPNRMEAVLVSDSEALKAVASVNVRVGYYDDPDDVPGMAHFLEHMLFLGNRKYPKPTDYSVYLNSHGGSANAFTSSTATNYYFTVDADRFEGGIDRLSQFFVSPLFDASYTQRELNAINAEHSKNVRNDGRRMYQVRAELARPDHPASKFSTGNADTLAGVPDLRERLLEFYRTRYSANKMRVVLLGKESLDELQAYAEKYFSAVENRELATPEFGWQTLRPEVLPGILEVKSLKETKQLRLSFEMPDRNRDYADKSLNVFSALVGDESTNSLHYQLTRTNLITSLGAGTYSQAGRLVFGVSMNLTEKGLESVEEIITRFFAYVRLVIDGGLEEWRYDEQKRMAEFAFRFGERGDSLRTAIDLASADVRIPPKDLLFAPHRYGPFDAESLKEDYLSRIVPEKMLVTVVSKEAETDRREKWYGAEYSFRKPSPETLSGWREAFEGKKTFEGLALRGSNPFIPREVELFAKEEAAPEPWMLREEEGFVFWHLHDDRFNSPYSRLAVRFEIPKVYRSPENSLMTRLLLEIWRDGLTPAFYPSREAGYGVSVDFSTSGLSLSQSGYNDRFVFLLSNVLEATRRVEVTPEKFETLKENLLRNWKNMEEDSALNRLFYEMRHLTTDAFWYRDEYLAAADLLTLDNVKRFAEGLFDTMTVKAFLYGNAPDDFAERVASTIGDRFRYVPSSEGQRYFPRYVDLPDGEDLVRSIQVKDKDAAAVWFFQGKDHSLKGEMLASLFLSVVKGPFYDTLRTQEQLGYIVNSGQYGLNFVPGVYFLVQSPEKDPVHLKERMRSFLEGFSQTLSDLPEEQLESTKTALIKQLLDEPKSSDAAFGHYWGLLNGEGEPRFDKFSVMASVVESVEKRDLLDFYAELIGDPDNAELVLMGWGKDFEVLPVEGEAIEDGFEFKREQRVFGFRSFDDLSPQAPF